jgi:hypothetical protein
MPNLHWQPARQCPKVQVVNTSSRPGTFEISRRCFNCLYNKLLLFSSLRDRQVLKLETLHYGNLEKEVSSWI